MFSIIFYDSDNSNENIVDFYSLISFDFIFLFGYFSLSLSFSFSVRHFLYNLFVYVEECVWCVRAKQKTNR